MNAIAMNVLRVLVDEGPLSFDGVCDAARIAPDEARQALRYLDSLYLAERFIRPNVGRKRQRAYFRATPQGVRELERLRNA